jgi:hypothetical protein
MHPGRVVVVSVWILALLAASSRAASAEKKPFANQHGPALSGSIGIALQPGGPSFHAWLGAGVRVPAPRFQAVLVGIELDAPIPDDEAEPAGPHTSASMESPGAAEVWLVARAVWGEYAGVGFAPRYSVYAFAGAPLSLDQSSPAIRVGVGAAAIELLQLAELGIPNMIELGMDTGGQGVEGFLRLGWHI